MGDPLLELRGVGKSFGGLKVIDDLDLSVDRAEIVSVIGPNGAGKTTLFNLVTGVFPPDEGDIVFEGRSLKGLDPHRITNRGIARTFQTLRLFLNMTVKENVMAAAYGHTRAGIVEAMLRTPRMRREAAAGMNPVETHEITELIGRLRNDGGYTILVIEHDMHVVEGISDRVVALDHGVKIAEGSFEAVATNERVVEAYLGLNTMSRK